MLLLGRAEFALRPGPQVTAGLAETVAQQYFYIPPGAIAAEAAALGQGLTDAEAHRPPGVISGRGRGRFLLRPPRARLQCSHQNAAPYPPVRGWNPRSLHRRSHL